MTSSKLMPRQAVPDLDLATVGGGRWRLADQTPQHFSMIVFYRGLHCPICSMYLKDLHNRLEEIEGKGVSVIAASSDVEERAAQAKADWGLDRLTVGYGLELDQARRWGLYVSNSIGTTSTGFEEPAQFSEPGVFLVRPDGTLYYGSTQTMPFARPSFADLGKAMDFAIAKNYPARGEAA